MSRRGSLIIASLSELNIFESVYLQGGRMGFVSAFLASVPTRCLFVRVRLGRPAC